MHWMIVHSLFPYVILWRVEYFHAILITIWDKGSAFWSLNLFRTVYYFGSLDWIVLYAHHNVYCLCTLLLLISV